jgi:hypothetical protein
MIRYDTILLRQSKWESLSRRDLPTVEHRRPSELDQMSIRFGPTAYERVTSVFSYFEPCYA